MNEVKELENQLALMRFYYARASQLDSFIHYLIKVIVTFNLKIDFTFLGEERNNRLRKAILSSYQRFHHFFKYGSSEALKDIGGPTILYKEAGLTSEQHSCTLD